MVTTLNVIGLLANMAGTIIAFFYGYPQPSHDESVGFAFSDGTVFENGESVKQIEEDARQTKSKYLCYSRLGLALMFFGFTVQLIALCM